MGDSPNRVLATELRIQLFNQRFPPSIRAAFSKESKVLSEQCPSCKWMRFSSSNESEVAGNRFSTAKIDSHFALGNSRDFFSAFWH